MGGGTPRASTSARAAARTSPERIPLPPSFLRLPPPSFPRPLPRHSCAGRNPPHPNAPKPLPQENSSLPPSRGEARWGVERRERPPATEPPPALSGAHPPTVIPAPLTRHPCTPHPSFLRPLSVIPAQVGTPQPPAPRIPPLPNSSLPPTRGEARWGVERRERPPAAEPPPALFGAHPQSRHSCAPIRHSCAGRNQATSGAGTRLDVPTARRGRFRARPLVAERSVARAVGSCLRRNDGERAE